MRFNKVKEQFYAMIDAYVAHGEGVARVSRDKSRSLIVRFVAGIYGMILFLVGLCPKQKFKAIVQMGKINAWLNNNQAFVFMRRMSDI